MPKSPTNFQAITAAASTQQISPKSAEQAMAEQNALEGEIKKEFNRLLVLGLRWGAYILFAVIVIRVWHLVGINQICGIHLKWLSPEELQSIDKMLFSSAFGGAVISYLKDTVLKSNNL